ncbi:hypothetical protein DdX_21740 [Ditylenchus destructor]|uniref:Uncharacterized protein n=1 Tax=Ditylenchus destructor TaxID=166010 RepID=A0AAD4MFY5_9BILA|nr:hypothetical protein DdX_21740 [Ditylenchus destructor]
MNKTVVETIMGEMDASAAEISNTAEPQTKSPKDKSPKNKDGKPEKPKKTNDRRSEVSHQRPDATHSYSETFGSPTDAKFEMVPEDDVIKGK